MEVVEVEGGVTVFLSEHFGNVDSLEFIGKESPLVAKSDHSFDTFLMLHFERYGGCGLRGGVCCLYKFQTGCRLLFLRQG